MKEKTKKAALPFTQQDIKTLDELLSPDGLDKVLYPKEEWQQAQSLLSSVSPSNHPLHYDYTPSPTFGTLIGKPRHDEALLNQLREGQASRLSNLENTVKAGAVYRHISKNESYRSAEALFDRKLKRRSAHYQDAASKIHFLRISLLSIGRFLLTDGRTFRPKNPTATQRKNAKTRVLRLLKADFHQSGVSLQQANQQAKLIQLLIKLHAELSAQQRKPTEGKEAAHAEFVRHVSEESFIAFGEASERLIQLLAQAIGTTSDDRTVSRWRSAAVEQFRLENP